MRSIPAITVLTMFAALGAAQDRMADTLRKGVVEEESKGNLNAAIQDYQQVLAQFDESRQTAATALFRMAESYRKQGKDDQALAAYQRVVRDFADQSKLAERSRAVLTGAYKVAPTPSADTDDKLRSNARKNYRATIEGEIDLVNRQIREAQKKIDLGVESPNEMYSLQRELLQLQRQLDGFDAGIPQPVATPPMKK